MIRTKDARIAAARLAVRRRYRGSKIHSLLVMVAVALTAGIFADARAGNSIWENYSDRVYTLAPRESMQLRVTWEDIQVRSWQLVVDGGHETCDLSVLRVRGESLLYYNNDESHHEVLVPWGVDEEIIAVVTNRTRQATFTVSLLGPPRDQVHAAYGYHVNRALEAFAGGRRLEAEEQCRRALRDNPDDGVAKVLLAGFRRDRQFLDEAAGLVDEALEGPLSPDMRTLAEELRSDLRRLRAPLPLPVRHGVDEAENALAHGKPEVALEACTRLLEGDLELDAPSRSRLLRLKGRALTDLERNFEAIDAYTQALTFNRNRADVAVIYYHMGGLFLAMDNLAQAEGSFTMALGGGLPSSLALKAREQLQQVQNRLAAER